MRRDRCRLPHEIVAPPLAGLINMPNHAETQDVRDRVLKHLVIVSRKAPLGRYQVRLGLFDPQTPDWRHRVPVRSAFRQQQGAVIIPDVLNVNQAAKP